MAYKSFFQDMVLDTPEAIKNFEDLLESGVTWKYGGSVIEFADEDFYQELLEKYSAEEEPHDDEE